MTTDVTSAATEVTFGTEPTDTHRSHRPRADAVRNRERILVAARDVFVEDGPQAPLDEIAKRAGIGNATLYRHFADRQSLLQAVLLFIMRRTADHAETASVENIDAFAALRQFMHHAVDERIGAVCGLLLEKGEQMSVELSSQCSRVETTGESLLDRARTNGQIRNDVGLEDLIVSMSQLSRPLPGVEFLDKDVHRRLDLLLDGLRVPTPASIAAAGEEPAMARTKHMS
ncbi:TetR/AcrR family transcriptional regulator [Streptomyces sp. NPDC051362]|uniref:TetR/AcrR family transcriptional regulator n=1 Tax=Streptomyces sp. NPDC051362 TaxID=3365651 RepID=UPI0037AD32CE